MDAVININNEEEKDKPKLQLITGGKGSGGTSNWLLDLAPGTVFYARAKNDPMDFNAYLFRKAGETDGKVVHLNVPGMPPKPDGTADDKPVIPTAFVNKFILHHVLGVVGMKETEDDAGDRNEGDAGVPADDVEGHDRR